MELLYKENQQKFPTEDVPVLNLIAIDLSKYNNINEFVNRYNCHIYLIKDHNLLGYVQTVDTNIKYKKYCITIRNKESNYNIIGLIVYTVDNDMKMIAVDNIGQEIEVINININCQELIDDIETEIIFNGERYGIIYAYDQIEK